MQVFIKHNDVIKIIGKIHPTNIPAFILSFAPCVTMPTTPEPMEAPKSPPIASSANNPVPPRGILLDATLIVPGHIIPTEKPQMIQPANPKTGLAEIAASR